MHAKKNKPMYGKGGMAKLAKYMNGGRIYAENGDQVPPSRAKLLKSVMGEKAFIDKYGWPEDKAAFYEGMARKDTEGRHQFDGSPFNGSSQSPVSKADPKAAEKLIEEARRLEKKIKMTGVSDPLSGAYRDAGEGEAAELERFLDAYGIFGKQSSGGLTGELQQIASGIKSYLSGDGYKRGYNDEYFTQQKESNQERYDTPYHEPFKNGGTVKYRSGGMMKYENGGPLASLLRNLEQAPEGMGSSGEEFISMQANPTREAMKAYKSALRDDPEYVEALGSKYDVRNVKFRPFTERQEDMFGGKGAIPRMPSEHDFAEYLPRDVMEDDEKRRAYMNTPEFKKKAEQARRSYEMAMDRFGLDKQRFIDTMKARGVDTDIFNENFFRFDDNDNRSSSYDTYQVR